MALRPGSTLAIRDVNEGAVYFAWPVRVVEDGPHGLLVAQSPGAVGRVPRGYPDDRAQTLERLATRCPQPVELTWARTVTLALWVPGQWWATRIFWDAATGAVMGYYVDFVRPLRLHGAFLDTLDLALDIVVTPEGALTLKDEAEYEQLRELGWISPHDHDHVQQSLPSVVAAIESGSFPFDGSFLGWRWPAEWSAAVMPENWEYAND